MVHLSGWLVPTLLALAASTLPTYPVLDVKLRAEDRDKQLTPGEKKVLGVPAPYSTHRPKPFYYLADVQQKKSSPAAFLVAGTNCDQALKLVKTISGVDLELLSQRARAGNQNPDSDPAWQGVNNRSQRSSIDGFLKVGQSMRDVLLKDNEAVREMGLTHQAVAAPVLAAMELMMEMVESGKDWDPDSGFEFVWEGIKYRVQDNTLGALYFPGLQYDDNMKKVTPERLPAARTVARKRVRSYRTGWTGSGVQGSFFNDEIYSSCALTFTNDKGKSFSIDCLTPHLIFRYGFYQGGPYRKRPDEIVAFFRTQPSESTKMVWQVCGN